MAQTVEAAAVVGACHDGPIAGTGAETAQVEAQGAHGALDDAEGELDGLPAPLVETLSIIGLQLGFMSTPQGSLICRVDLDGRRWAGSRRGGAARCVRSPRRGVMP